MERPVVRVTPIPEDQVPEDVPTVDSLARPVGRVIKILHSHTVTNGESGSADLLQDDAYVLRRQYELNSRLTADLDGRIVAVDSDATGPTVSISLLNTYPRRRHQSTVGFESETDPAIDTVEGFCTTVRNDTTSRRALLRTRLTGHRQRARE